MFKDVHCVLCICPKFTSRISFGVHQFVTYTSPEPPGDWLAVVSRALKIVKTHMFQLNWDLECGQFGKTF